LEPSPPQTSPTKRLHRPAVIGIFVLLAVGALLLAVAWTVGGSAWILPIELAIILASAALLTFGVWADLLPRGDDESAAREARPRDVVHLTVVSNEVEAELLCSRLRHRGIKCLHRTTPFAAGVGEGLPGMAGPREVLVRATDLRSARELLRHMQHQPT
jgi:hypothetical protein